MKSMREFSNAIQQFILQWNRKGIFIIDKQIKNMKMKSLFTWYFQVEKIKYTFHGIFIFA